jgi:hypothetical protein
MTLRPSLALALAATLAACSQAEEGAAVAPTPAEADAPASSAAPATAPDRNGEAPPLSVYVGKHPTEPVQGVTFFQHPDVRAAMVASGVDRDIQKSIVFDGNVVGVVTETRGRLLLHGYDPAGAGSTNWAILMIPDGSKAAVCYSTGIVGYEKGADWYFEGDVAFTLYTPCPSEEGDMESLSNWPIGPIPG